ncbi:MAG: TonB-dependent receptor [Myxococcales bacterium]|jgi:outer membrane receptor protein involved in Fe transport
MNDGVKRSLGVAAALVALLGVNQAVRAQQPDQPQAPPEEKAPQVKAEPEAEPAPATQAEPAPATQAEPAPASDAAPATEAEPEPAPATEPAPAPASEADAEASAEISVGLDASASAEPEGSDEGAPLPDEDIEEIVVTGSRVKRSDAFGSAGSLEIVSREDLEYSGATNLQDVVQYLTVAQGSGFQGGSGGAGTTSINLRGLGGGTTLVLLNGRRISPSGGGIASHFADIGAIPMAAVERIEIFKGGASAIYGSDAVAGVVNIITKTDWEGVHAEVDVQSTDNLDQEDYTASVAFGAVSERSRVTMSLQYFNRSQLTANERDFTADANTVSGTGFPGTYLRSIELIPDANCEDAPLSEVNEDGFCSFNFRDYLSLLGNLERASAYAHGEFDITDHTQIFAELNVARTRTDGAFSPSFPFPPEFPTVPADHVDNPFGQDVQFIGRPLGAESGPQINTSGDDTFRTAVGFRGDFEDAAANTFAEDWEWELFATFGGSRYRQIIHDTIKEEFQDALNSCSDPSDLSGCFNPFYTSQTGAGTPNSDAVIATFDGAMENLTDHALQTYDAGITGSLFELPGGDLGFALGGQLRHEWRSTELDHDANQQRYAFIIGNTDAFAERDIYGAYGELVAPFYNGIEVQLAGRVEKYTDTDSLAGSPTLGLTVVPAEIVGRDTVVKPLRRLQLRGHISRSFRAPTIYQSFPGFAVTPGLFTLPGSPLPVFVPVQSFGNPDLDPEKATAINAGFDWSPDDWLLLTFDYWQYDYQGRIDRTNSEQIVRNDEAARMADGADWDPDPRVIRGNDCDNPLVPCIERIQVQQMNTGDVFTNGIDFGAMFKLDGETFGGSSNDFGTISFGAQGTYTLSYVIPQAFSSVLALEDGTTLTDDDDEFVYDDGCDGEECEVVGLRNSTNFAPPLPQLRVNTPVTWAMDGHSVSLIGHFISGFEDDSVADMNGNFEDVDSWFTLDLQYAYSLLDTVGKETTIRVGVYNLTETEPPVVGNAGLSLSGFEPAVHDPRGRMIYGKLIQKF